MLVVSFYSIKVTKCFLKKHICFALAYIILFSVKNFKKMYVIPVPVMLSLDRTISLMLQQLHAHFLSTLVEIPLFSTFPTGGKIS